MDLTTIQNLIQSHGLWLLAPISVLEGPIVTVVAAWFAAHGLMNVYAVYVICVLGDLVGDAIMYGLGRYGPRILPGRWQLRLGLGRRRRQGLRDHFGALGGRTLIIGKLTHSAGAAVLLAAGAARMSFWSFLFYNLVGTLPKTLAFVMLGYSAGFALGTIDHYLGRVTLILALVLLATAIGWVWYRRRRSGP